MNSFRKSLITPFSLFLVVFLFSCSKDRNNNVLTNATLAPAEAVEIIEASLQKSTGGLNDNIEQFAQELSGDITINDLCNVLYDSVFTLNYDGQLIDAAYSISRSYELACNNFNVPQSVAFNYDMDGTYSTQKINSDDSTALGAVITGLQPTESDMILNGNYFRTGTQLFNGVNNRSVESVLDMSITTLTIDKNTSSIAAGEGSFELTGSTENNDFTFSGTITFNGNGQATLVVNGNTYLIDLN